MVVLQYQPSFAQTDRGTISGKVVRGTKPVLDAIIKFTMERSPTGFRKSTKSLPPDGKFADEMPQGWILVNAFKKEDDGTILLGNARIKVDTNLGAIVPQLKMEPGAAASGSLFRMPEIVVQVASLAPIVFQSPANKDVKVTVEGVVTNGETPIAAFVVVSSADTGDEVASIHVESGGKYSMTVAPGDYLVDVVAERYRSTSFVIRVGGGGEIVINGADGTPVDHNTLVLARAEEDSKASAQDDLGAAPKTETRTFSRLYSFSGPIIEALPLSGIRNLDSLGLLVPGVAPAPATEARTGPSFGPTLGTAGQLAANGMRARDNNFTVDGSDNNDEEVGVRRQGFVAPFPQPPEGVEEFQIVAALPEAQFGHNIGAQVNALSKYGQSRFHVAAHGFMTGTPLIARDYFSMSPTAYQGSFQNAIPITANGKLDGAPVLFDGATATQPNPLHGKDSYTRVQTGLTVGGPISNKHGTFGFGSWERQIINASQTENYAVPTVQQRGFYGCGTGCNGRALPMAVNGATTADGDGVFSLFPFPNNPLGPYSANTYTETRPADGLADVLSAKVDQQFNIGHSSHILTVRHNATIEHSTIPETGGALFSSVKPLLRVHNFSLFFTSSFGNKFANTFRTSYGRTAARFDEARDPFLTTPTLFPELPFLLNAPLLINTTGPNDAQFSYASENSPAAQAKLAAGHLITNNADSINGPLGEVYLAGFSRLGVDVFHLPQSRAHGTIQFADSADLSLNRQHISLGFDLRDRHLNSTIEKNVRPYVAFPSLRVPQAAQGNLPTDLLPGTVLAADGSPGAIFQTLAFNPSHLLQFQRTEVDVYLQDKIQLNDRFQLNGGARLLYSQLPQSTDPNLAAAFDIDTLKAEVQSGIATCPTTFAGLPALYTTRCQKAITALGNAFPSDFRSTFGAQKFKTDIRLGFVWTPTSSSKTVVRGGFGTYTGGFPTIIANESRDPFPGFLSIEHPGSFTPSPIGGLYDFTAFLTQKNSLNLIDAPALGYQGPQDAVNLLGLIGAVYDPILSLVQPASGLKNPYSEQFSLAIERQLSSKSTMSVSYVGTLGRRLVRVTTPNMGLYRSQARYYSGKLYLFGAQANVPNVLDTTNYPDPIGAVQTRFDGSGKSNYHSLQVDMRHRFSSVSWNTAFTYSHSIDQVSDFFDTSGDYALPQDSLNQSERASSSFDVRLRMVNYFVWDAPIGGIQVSGIYTNQTGQPFTVNSSVDSNQDGNMTDRPMSSAGIAVTKDPLQKLQLQADPFTLLAPIGQDGSLGRNTFRANGIHNLDLAISRKFVMRDEHTLQIRAETFNAFNRTEFAMPVRILESPAFGKSVSTSIGPRTIQFALKYQF